MEKISSVKYFTFLLFFSTIFLAQNIFALTGQVVDSWVQLSTAPGAAQGAGVCVVYAEKDGQGKIYSMRGGSSVFQIYDIATDVWITTTSLPYSARAGAAMTWDGGNFIYMLLGGTTFYQYDISETTFTRLADPPGSVSGGGDIVYVSTSAGTQWCYATQGGSLLFWRYSIETNQWAAMANVNASGTTGAGTSLVWTTDNFIYATRAAGATAVVFRRYNIDANSWSALQDSPATMGAGGSITWDGVILSSNIYVARGGSNSEFWRYNISANQWYVMQSLSVTMGTNSGNRIARFGDYIYGRLGTTNATDSFYRYRWRDVDAPGATTGFIAETGANGGEINLSWISPGNDGYVGDLPAGSTFYIQYASWTGVNFSTTTLPLPPVGGYDIRIPTGPVTQGTTAYYTVSGLLESVTYYFCIWTRDNSGNWSEISTGATAQVQITPTAPTDLNILAVSSSTISLGWSLTNAVTYRVEHSTGPEETLCWIFRSTVSATSYTDTNLFSGTTYWYRLSGLNSAGILSTEHSNIVSSPTIPSAPQVLSPINRTATSITWNWTTVIGADGFRIYRTTDNSVVAELSSAATFYNETGLAINSQCGRYVSAYNISGESLDSNYATFYTLALAPINLQVTAVNQSSATLTWERGENPPYTKFGLSRSTEENFSVTVTTFVNFASGLTATTTDTIGLGSDTTYYFRLWAYNEEEIPTTFISTFIKTLPGPPPAPNELYGFALSTSSIKWEWSTALGANDYRVYRATDNTVVAELSSAATFYNETGLAINSQYGRYVRAFNNSGFGASSPQATFYTLANPPIELKIVSVALDSVSLSWEANHNPSSTNYELQYSTDSGFAVIMGTSPYTTSLLATLYSLLPDTLYYSRVRAFNGDQIGTSFTTTVSTVTKQVKILISEWSADSTESAGGTEDDWIELYNPNDTPVNLTTWSLQIRTGVSTYKKINLTGIIPGRGFYLLVASGAVSALHSFADQVAVFDLTYTNRTIYIVSNQITLSSTTDTSSTVIDRVAYGTTNITPEGTALSGAKGSDSFERKANAFSTAGTMRKGGSDEFAGNSYDTENNADDFVRRTDKGEIIPAIPGAPQNTLSSPEPPWPDTTPPAAVTDLNALPGYTGGTIELTWTSPGDDGGSGTLVPGSQFKIQYSTSPALAGLPANAQVTIPTTGVNPGSSIQYLVSGLSPGVTYYFRLWTADESANYSEISNGATTYARPQTAVVNKDVDSDKDDTLIIFPNLDKEVEIIILAGTFDTSIATVTVTVERSTSICKPDPIKQSHLKGTGVGIEIQVKDKTGNLLQPQKTIKITFKYTDDEITGMKKENLTLAWFNQTKNEWELLPSTVYPAENKIVAEILHLSLFQIVEQIPAETVDNIFVYPNPCYLSKNQKPTFARLPENAEITIYTISGEKIYSATAGDTGYHIWTPENLASGIYIFVIKEQSSGKKKMGKLAIIR